jgi:membrane protein insertase Oxa1/YidC/SpoIIIJ
MQRTMLWISPLMIGYFALNVPAGLGLYWFIGNCVSIIQQSFVVGWGNVLPARFKPGAGGAPSTSSKKVADTSSSKRLADTSKSGPTSKNGLRNGTRPKKPKRQA